MRVSTFLFASSAAAQSAQFLPSNPGGALPANVQAPSISGFEDATVQPSRGGLAVCVSGTIPVQASAQNLKFNFAVPQNQSAATEVVAQFVTSGSPLMQQIMAGQRAVQGTYNISATYCTPANDTKPSTVQVLTHGVGFDRYYWDFAPGYSYVDVAAQYNQATFFYDRLGVGQSAKPDGLSVVQTPLQLEILHQLVCKLRAGSLSNTTFSRVVGVGHSFGSALTEGVTAVHPADFSAAVLTGFSTNSTGMATWLAGINPQIAANVQPYRFAALSPAYLVAGSVSANQLGFLRAPNFDPAVLSVADATKGTVTYGELFSIMAVIKPATAYTGPVAVVNGAEDLPFCTGNCSVPANLAAAVVPALYPKAARSNALLVPVTGHGINLHYSAVSAYQWIQKFLANGTSS